MDKIFTLNPSTTSDDIIILIEQKLQELDLIIAEKEIAVQNAPMGTLVTKRSGNYIQYYHRTNPKDTHGDYIPSSDIEMKTALAQKEYDKKLLRMAKDCKARLDKCMKQLCINNSSNIVRASATDIYSISDEIFYSMHPSKRKYVTPITN